MANKKYKKKIGKFIFFIDICTIKINGNEIKKFVWNIAVSHSLTSG